MPKSKSRIPRKGLKKACNHVDCFGLLSSASPVFDLACKVVQAIKLQQIQRWRTASLRYIARALAEAGSLTWLPLLVPCQGLKMNQNSDLTAENNQM